MRTSSTPERTTTPSEAPGEAGVPAPEPRRSSWTRIPYGLRAKVTVGLFIVMVWQFAVPLIAPPYVALPSSIAAVLPTVLTGSEFWTAFGATMVPIVQGLMIAIAAAVVVGLAMGQILWIGWALKGYTNALFAMPMVAVVPLMTIWAGYTETARLAIVIFAAYFPMVVNVYDGSQAVSQRYLEVASTYRAPRRAVWFGVVLPSSIPYLLTGFRLASGRALVAAVVAEYLINIEGLGVFILINARSFRHPEAFVGVLTLAAMGVLILWFARWGTRRFAPWYDPARG